MAQPGPKPRPALTVAREGNPGKRAVLDSAKLPPSALREPAWEQLIGGKSAEAKHIRSIAADLWRRLAPTLSRSVGLVGEQQETLIDYCVTWARVVQGERALSREGVTVDTRYGVVKNPWTTVLNQYRSHMRSLIGELGLSPSAASRIPRQESLDGEDPFDD